MEAFRIRDLSFQYPNEERPALKNVSLTLNEGELMVLCGPSGCGKSTLLRQLKPDIAPSGVKSGEIFIMGTPLLSLDRRELAGRIGFVSQNPENSIVTDKVWHELAFGLESMGLDTPTIRRRTAEMASFFGIGSWYYKDVSELSGGQKQLLTLASVMAMQPDVLILDEPTAQLDPIAASDFLATVGRINRELGTTVLLTEHRLEDAFAIADRAAFMDGGELLFTDTPERAGERLRELGHGMFHAMPAAMRVWAAAGDSSPCPLTVAEGRGWLRAYNEKNPLLPVPERGKRSFPSEALRAEGLWFRYEKEHPDTVKGLTLTLGKGEFMALLGGNGAGKSTTLKLLMGIKKPYRGEVRLNGSIALLPQDPQTLFVKKTVREDLKEALKDSRLGEEDKEARLAHVVALCRLTSLLDRHPYDLSGGEQQRAALAKVLLSDPEILLMDEPTKGLDAEFKQLFAGILRTLLTRGVSILTVSHDVEFCARYADRCALFFDGSVVTEGAPREFFGGSSFYTTAASRMSRGLVEGAVTAEELMLSCGALPPPEPEPPKNIPPMPEPKPETADWRPPKLPLWRRIGAALTGAGALFLFLRFLGVADLNSLISSDGLSALAGGQLTEYGIFIVLLIAFAALISRKSAVKQTVKREKLSRRTVAAAVLILLFIPLTLYVGVTVLEGRKYYFISLLILLETMLPFFLVFEGRKPKARELVLIAVLCALGVAGRAFFFMLPQFKPVLALTVIAGVAFGGETGFLVGAMTMLASNVLFSQGPWTPWQMFAMGIIGFLAGVLFKRGLLRRSRLSLSVFGALCAILIYGGVMNPASALMWAGKLNFGILASYYISGFPMDCVHAAATWLFLWFGAEPMLTKLDRIKVKYGLVES